MARALLGVLIAVLGVVGSQAKVHTAVVDKDDRRLIPLTDAFGFAADGKLDIRIRDIELYRLHGSSELIDSEKFGFFLSPVEADPALEQDLVQETPGCILDDVNNLFTFKDSSVQNVIKGNLTEFAFHFVVKNGGLFYLYFANCEDDTPVSFTSEIEMYNVNAHGGKDYLSIGDTHLDAVYWVSSTRGAEGHVSVRTRRPQ